MLCLETDQLRVCVDVENGADITSLISLPDALECVHRGGLQAWIKSGSRRDPASGVLSNYYAGIASPCFTVSQQTDTMLTLAATVQDLAVTKRIHVDKNSVTLSVDVKNVASSDVAIPVQIENFCNLSSANVEERDKTVVFLANGRDVVVESMLFLEKWGQRYVRPFDHNGESIVVGNTGQNATLEISTGSKADPLALVIHGNRLCWGICGSRESLAPGASTSYTLTVAVRAERVSDRFSFPERSTASRKSSFSLDGALFAGAPVFTERWSHLCLQYDATDPDDLKKVIGDLLAPLKYSGVVFECNRGVRLKSHPEIAADFALDIDTVRDIADFARAHGLKVGVEFNSPGHQNETGIPEAHPELMEPRQEGSPGHVLCVSNPSARRLLSDIIAELQEALEPDMFHFGADEVQFAGYKGTPFGHCRLCRNQRPHELFADYLGWLFSLTAQGVQPAIWSDMFLQLEQFGDGVEGNGSEGDVWKALSAVPSNTVLLDWHYHPADAYRSLDYFRDRGYNVWPVTAFGFEGVRTFLVYAERIGVAEAMHTTWSVPGRRKLFIETMFWAACYHWQGKRADEIDVRRMAVEFCRRFW